MNIEAKLVAPPPPEDLVQITIPKSVAGHLLQLLKLTDDVPGFDELGERLFDLGLSTQQFTEVFEVSTSTGPVSWYDLSVRLKEEK